MINIKNAQEIINLKKSCQIIKEVKAIVQKHLQVGTKAIALDQLAEKEIKKRGAQPSFKGYMGFKHTLCISFNEEMIHGIPTARAFKDKDIIKIDMGCVYNGMHSDTAFTKALGTVSPQDQNVIDTAKESFFAGLKAIKPGARIGDISHAIGKHVKKQGLFVPSNFAGHGIGQSLHEDPYIYNDGKKGTGPLIKDGMALCIEPMILQKSNDAIIKEDGWTVVSPHKLNTAHYEQTILIENGQPIILTEDI